MLQRSTSPIFFARHPPASRAQDISRLLDPAYSSAAFATNSAYVDRHGELHDPDYRHFPVAQPRRRASNITVATRPHWESFDDDQQPEDDHFSPRRTSFSSYQPRRPVYSYSYVPAIVIPDSVDSADTVLDDCDDASPRPSGVSRILSRTKREFSRKRRSLDGASHSSASPYYSSALLAPDTPTTTTDTVVSEEPEPDAASLHAPSHHHPLAHTLSRFSCHSATPIHTARRHRARSASPDPEYSPTQDPEHEQPWTPTCAHALRRQWQSVSLRIRFSLFRAQRRMKSRLAML